MSYKLTLIFSFTLCGLASEVQVQAMKNNKECNKDNKKVNQGNNEVFSLGILPVKDLKTKLTKEEQKELEKKLHVAAHNGDMIAVRELLEKGADIDAPTDEFTPLFLICHFSGAENSNMVKLLLEKGAQPNFKERFFKRTPLHNACQSSFLKCAKLLIEHNAFLFSADRYQSTPWNNLQTIKNKASFLQMLLPLKKTSSITKLLEQVITACAQALKRSVMDLHPAKIKALLPVQNENEEEMAQILVSLTSKFFVALLFTYHKIFASDKLLQYQLGLTEEERTTALTLLDPQESQILQILLKKGELNFFFDKLLMAMKNANIKTGKKKPFDLKIYFKDPKYDWSDDDNRANGSSNQLTAKVQGIN